MECKEDRKPKSVGRAFSPDAGVNPVRGEREGRWGLDRKNSGRRAAQRKSQPGHQ